MQIPIEPNKETELHHHTHYNTYSSAAHDSIVLATNWRKNGSDPKISTISCFVVNKYQQLEVIQVKPSTLPELEKQENLIQIPIHPIQT